MERCVYQNFYTGGLWVKKKQYIAGFDAGTANKVTWTAPQTGAPFDTDNYFFLPSSGNSYYTPAGQGTGGRYWSSTPTSDKDKAYRLYFDTWGLLQMIPIAVLQASACGLCSKS